MEELLKDYAVKALEWLESGAAWIAEEIPIYVTEVLKWEVFSSFVYLVLGLVFMIGPLFAIKPMLKKHKEAEEGERWNNPYNGEWLLLLIPSIGFFGVGVPMFIYQLLEIIKVTVAPRVYLIEYFSNMF